MRLKLTILFVTVLLLSGINFVNVYATSGNFTFVFPIMNDEDPQRDVEILKPHMTGNDIVLFPAANYTYVSSLPNQIPGLGLGTGGTSITTLKNVIPTLPSNVKYVTYDYERGWSPEWTNNFAISMNYFEDLHNATQSSGKKFMPFPVFVLAIDWHWSEVVKNSDVYTLSLHDALPI